MAIPPQKAPKMLQKRAKPSKANHGENLASLKRRADIQINGQIIIKLYSQLIQALAKIPKMNPTITNNNASIQ